MSNHIYTVVTFGSPGIPRRAWTKNFEIARRDADAAKGSGTCTGARVYECESVAIAKGADVSRVRDGERVAYVA